MWWKLKKILAHWRCMVGVHDWGKWLVVAKGRVIYYDNIKCPMLLQERECHICGRIQSRMEVV